MPDCSSDFPFPLIKPNKLGADDIKQVHDYIRHLFQMFLTWFTVFATVNYAAMGWLAGWTPNARFNSIAGSVALVFVIQNGLALVCSWYVWQALQRQADLVGGSEGVVPTRLYKRAIALIAAALVVTACTWVRVGWIPVPSPIAD